MASHFATIGLPISTQEEMLRFAQRAWARGRWLTAPEGRYVRWEAGGGAELWLQVDRDGDLSGCTPHFDGESRMRVALTSQVARPDGGPLEGAFHAWADPQGDDPESGCYPFVFDAPDYALHGVLELPEVALVQVAAFAHELSAYPDDDAYYASQEGEPVFGAESFIPSGLFEAAEAEGGDAPPPAHAVFTGHVVQTGLRRCRATGCSFHWTRVRTYGGELDMVAHPETVEGRLAPGGVVSGSFWLSGRIHGLEPARPARWWNPFRR